jgi:Uma2 family endonuclease
VSTTEAKLMTADELLRMPDNGLRYELVKGELKRMPPTGDEHGAVTLALAAALYQYVKLNNLGRVYAAETGFKLESDPDTVRAPDIAFVKQERVDEVGDTKSYWPGAPDLAVGVISPNDKVSEIEEKVKEWLEAGTSLVWVVSPKLHTVTVYRSLTDIIILTEKDMLDGGEIVPGFLYPVVKLFAIKRR